MTGAFPLPLDAPVSVQPAPIRAVPATMADRLIVALDVESVDRALTIVGQLEGVISFFKIGFRLQIAAGFDTLVEHLLKSGKKIFLDAKMFDVPETVERAVSAAAKRGFSFITVHGDANIMRAAVKGRGDSDLKVFAVTVLTSLSDSDLAAMGYAVTARQLVELRARQAVECQCDGIIASADDDPNTIRALAGDPGLLIATPGIRQPGSKPDDQKRTATPAEAIQNGADYLVAGRPIIAEIDPAAAARRVIAQMESGGRLRHVATPS